jgi:hypothetical protein
MRMIIAAVSLLAFGCTESVESNDVRTSGVYPEITVTATGNGSSTVRVRLKVGGSNSNTFLDLKGEDTLEASIGDEAPKTLDGSGETYSATFPTDAEGTEFTIAFLRGSQDDDAPASKVTMPAPFDLTVPPGEAGRGADAVDVTWDPPVAGKQMAWKLSGECIKLDSGSTPDDGAYSIEAGSIETFDADKDKTCTANFEMTRSQNGSVDPAFTEGGSVIARHVRTGGFTSAP